MTETNPTLRSTDRNHDLVMASVYERVIGASLERVWENVYDWEHLPYVHAEAFHSIEKIDAGEWGWAARIGIGAAPDASASSPASDREIALELVTRKDERRYVSRTLEGPGAPSEIWTHLDPVAADRTAIRVEFWVSPQSETALAEIGKGYVALYTLLWSQDEEMMQTREAALSDRSQRTAEGESPAPRSLGSLEALRTRLPIVTEFGGRSFRIVEIDDELVAFATECPHLLGPLDTAEVRDGRIVCPWHGYAFDVRTGRSCDGRRLLLSRAPRVVVDREGGEVELRSASSEP